MTRVGVDSVRARALRVFALAGLAVAQPVLDVLGNNPAFFAAHRTSRIGVVAFALACVVVPALVLIGIERGVALVSPRLGDAVHVVIVAVLGALLVVRARSLGAGLWVVLFVVVAIVVGMAYVRLEVARRFLTWLAIGPLVVVGLFLFASPARSFVLGGEGTSRAASGIGSPKPVVMLVFDEFSLGTLLDRSGEINGDRFPAFASLADRSTWFANATTNAIETHVALPALQAGVLPAQKKGRAVPPPITASYPDNVFTLLSSLPNNVDETVTQLCPVTQCPVRVGATGWKYLFADATVVYLHTALPSSVTSRFVPPLDARWAGFVGDRELLERRLVRLPGPVRGVARAVLRPFTVASTTEVARFDRFVAAVADDRPALHYMHLNLPHVPWELLPSLQRYDGEDVPGWDKASETWTSDRGVVDQALQRYVLQAKAADRLLGRLTSRLRRVGAWDDALVIVVADHGVAFEPGGKRRLDTPATAPDILRVPFFVKLPGQDGGRVDRRTAGSIDVLPTIVDVLGVESDVDLPGSSLAGRDPKRRSRVVRSQYEERTYPSDLGAAAITERMARLFGDGTDRDDIYAIGPHRELVGSRATADSSSEARVRVVAGAPRVRATISGDVPDWIAIGVNGRIAGLGRPFGGRLDVMVSHRYLGSDNELTFFAVSDDGELTQVR